MWRERINALPGSLTVQAPADEYQIADCARALGQALPADLAGLLRESNGVGGSYGLEVVWTAERIARENTFFRTDPEFPELYMPFEALLFFGDAGNGDQFAYRVPAALRNIYVWNHEDDSRTSIAPGIHSYLANVARYASYDAYAAVGLAYRHCLPYGDLDENP